MFFALQKTKMLPLHFVCALPKCILASKAFDAKMHLMPKCIFAYIFLWKMFSVHFPKENVQQTKMLESGKMHFGCAKMHFCITFSKGKCSAYIFQRKMFSITFDFVKCSASHFLKENVQQSKMLESGQHVKSKKQIKQKQ